MSDGINDYGIPSEYSHKSPKAESVSGEPPRTEAQVSGEPLNELDKQEWRDIVSGVRPDITNKDFDDMWVKFQEVKQRRSQQ